MNRVEILRFNDFPVKIEHPIDVDSIPNVPLNDAAGVNSATFKVFDPSVDEVLTVAGDNPDTDLNVTNAGKFKIGDDVEIMLDSDSVDLDIVEDVDAAAGTITINSLTGPAALGSRVRKIFGGSTTMLEYGTASLNTLTWGYSAFLANLHDAHKDSRAKDGLDAVIETYFDAGTGLVVRDFICIRISEDDCE